MRLSSFAIGECRKKSRELTAKRDCILEKKDPNGMGSEEMAPDNLWQKHEIEQEAI